MNYYHISATLKDLTHRPYDRAKAEELLLPQDVEFIIPAKDYHNVWVNILKLRKTGGIVLELNEDFDEEPFYLQPFLYDIKEVHNCRDLLFLYYILLVYNL